MEFEKDPLPPYSITMVVIELYHRTALKLTKGESVDKEIREGRITFILMEHYIVEIVTLGKNHRPFQLQQTTQLFTENKQFDNKTVKGTIVHKYI